jgi:hypothetical protein
MNTEILVQTLADTLLYLESVPDEKVSPESASAIYDIVAASLLRLDKADKAEMAQVLGALADATTNPEKAEFFADLPSGLGLVTGDES